MKPPRWLYPSAVAVGVVTGVYLFVGWLVKPHKTTTPHLVSTAS